MTVRDSAHRNLVRGATVSESSTSPCLALDRHGHPEDGESVAPKQIQIDNYCWATQTDRQNRFCGIIGILPPWLAGDCDLPLRQVGVGLQRVVFIGAGNQIPR